MNYDISKPRILEVEALNKKVLVLKSNRLNTQKKTVVAKIKDARTGREGTSMGTWVDNLKIGDKVSVRWERTAYRDKKTGKQKVSWAIRPAKV